MSCALRWIVLLVSMLEVSSCPTIVSREEWGAREPKPRSPLTRPVSYLVVHHTALKRCFTRDDCVREVKAIQDFHMGPPRNWSDIAYHFLIGEDCNIYEGRGWNYTGAHALGWNSISLGIVILGDFRNITPASCATDALRQMIECGHSRGALADDYTIYGHLQTQRPGYTECPGGQLICHISQLPNWKPVQANGTFVMPECISSGGYPMGTTSVATGILLLIMYFVQILLFH